MADRLQSILERNSEIEDLLAMPDVVSSVERVNQLAKERAELQPVVIIHQKLQEAQRVLSETQTLSSDDDREIAEMANLELPDLLQKVKSLQSELTYALVPVDPNDKKNAIVEIRGATGGDEAAIFGNDLLRMYTRYAENQKWKMNILSSSYSETGGIKEIVVEISGEGTFSKLKHESGVHRVQRVPKTESQGRIHTSTATVAVLPKSEEIDIEIKDDDIRTDVFHSGGAGGQNVNKVATAIRLTHSPSGIVVSCQNERSQLQNKIQAMEILKSKLWDLEIQKQQNERSEARKSQVGSGGRSEKIRTYNYPQGRITDHRIKLTSHRLSEFMDGLIDEIIEPVSYTHLTLPTNREV